MAAWPERDNGGLFAAGGFTAFTDDIRHVVVSVQGGKGGLSDA